MDKNTAQYYKTANQLKFKTNILDNGLVGFEILLGKKHYFFRGGLTPFNQDSSSSLAANKFCLNKRLESLGFPVPKAKAFHKEDFQMNPIENLIEDLCFPLVVKPMKGTSNGEDVLCNIQTKEALMAYMQTCYSRHPFLSIEEFQPGLNTYRVLVFFNQVIGVVERIPARIVGDGKHSIHELIRMHHVKKQETELIKIDEEVHTRLQELQLTLDDIPKEKEEITLCYTCDCSRGGSIHSLGKNICKENAKLLCRAAHVLGLNLVGFDVVCEDILLPIEKSRGYIIEANHDPDIIIHEQPMSGIQTKVSKIILRRMIRMHPIQYLQGLFTPKKPTYSLKLFAVLSILSYVVSTRC